HGSYPNPPLDDLVYRRFAPREPHSFPTRRSSDLEGEPSNDSKGDPVPEGNPLPPRLEDRQKNGFRHGDRGPGRGQAAAAEIVERNGKVSALFPRREAGRVDFRPASRRGTRQTLCLQPQVQRDGGDDQPRFGQAGTLVCGSGFETDPQTGMGSVSGRDGAAKADGPFEISSPGDDL